MTATVWVIRYTDRAGRAHTVAQLHNCVADYRANIDPRATAQEIDLPTLLEAAQQAAEFSLHASQQAGGYAATLMEYRGIKHRLRKALGNVHTPGMPPVKDDILRGNADLSPSQHASL